MGDPRGAVALTGGTTRARVAVRRRAGVRDGARPRASGHDADRRAGSRSTASRAQHRPAAAPTSTPRSPTCARATRAWTARVRVEWPDVGFLALLVAGARASRGRARRRPRRRRHGRRADRRRPRRILGRPHRRAALGPRRRRHRSDGDEQRRPLARDRRDGPRRRRRADARRHDRARRRTRAGPRSSRCAATRSASCSCRTSRSSRRRISTSTSRCRVIEVTGSVHVPRAALALDVLPAQAVTPSPDAVVHGQTSAHALAAPAAAHGHRVHARRRRALLGLNLDTTVDRRAARRDGAERFGERDGHVAARRAPTTRTANSSSSSAASSCSAARSTIPGSTCAPCAGPRRPTSRRRDRGRRRAHGHAEGAAHARVLDAGHERGRRAVVSAVRPAAEQHGRRHGHRGNLGAANGRAVAGIAASAARRAAHRQHARPGRAHGAVDGRPTPAR